MTSEAKKIVSLLKEQTGSIYAIFQQQAKIEELASNQFDAIFIIDLLNELKRLQELGMLDNLTNQLNAVFYFEDNKNILSRKEN